MTPTPTVSTFVIRSASSLSMDGDWRFSVHPQKKGESEMWFAPAYDDAAWHVVSVPHTLSSACQPSTGPDDTSAVEAPFIIFRDGKWYLFVSFDQCCQDINSTYNVQVGRSDALNGPYVDRDGVPLTEGGGTLILSAYGQWKGPGHNGILVEDGVYWMIYHAYDSKQIGIPKLRIESVS